MDIESNSKPLSAPSSTIKVPTKLQKTFNFNSRAQEIDTATFFSNNKYKDFNWLKFLGFQIPPPLK